MSDTHSAHDHPPSDADAQSESLTTPGVHPSQVSISHAALGRGSFGAVWRGTFSGGPVAVKVCSVAPSAPANSLNSARTQFRREMKRYRQLRHPCITQFFCVVQHDDGRLLLVTELMKGGSLFDAIGTLRRADVKKLATDAMLRISQHITNGLCYLHASHFSFGDLKSMNVLLSEFPDVNNRTFSETAQAKLCDFGLSRNLRHVADPHNPALLTNSSYVARGNGPTGTFAYLAPEAFKGIAPDDPQAAKAADIYALGVVLWEIATLNRPWAGRQALQLIRLVSKEGKRPEWPATVRELPPAFVQLVEDCWHQEPSKRPTADQVAKQLDEMYDELPKTAPSWSFMHYRPQGHVEDEDYLSGLLRTTSLSKGLGAVEVEEHDLPHTPVPSDMVVESGKDPLAFSAASHEKIHMSAVTGSQYTSSPSSQLWSSGPSSVRTEEGKSSYHLPPTPVILAAEIERELRFLDEEEELDLASSGICMHSRAHFE